MDGRYDFAAIEQKWQQHWEAHHTFVTPNPGDAGFDAARPKYYVLDMFPYPSGAGLHVGHPEGYTATDVLARYQRMRGRQVLHPMGWDAFGLPAEQYALETNTHPRITTERNISTFRRQLKALGFSYDWSREFATTDPDYYRWTQWIFLKLFDSYYDENADAARPISELVSKLENEALAVGFDGTLTPIMNRMMPLGGVTVGVRLWHELTVEERRAVLDDHRLAYVTEAPVNWCPALGTVLANEEVTSDGRSERGNFPVFRRPLKQWMLRITAYADRLISDLTTLDWPEPVKLMQRNWIGRSDGARVRFVVAGPPRPVSEPTDPEDDADTAEIEIFTTRPDTLYGATYMVLSPEHPLLALDAPDCIVVDAWAVDTPAAWKGVGSAGDTPSDAVRAYQRLAAAKADKDRTADTKSKTGVFTGAYAINPAFPAHDPRARIPIFVADYVLMGYGTGAIMAVPGHDTRDLEFAQAFGLPIIQVVQPPSGHWQGFVEDGVAVNSPPEPMQGVCDLNNLTTPAAKQTMIEWLERGGIGQGEVQYKLRDWLFSRQRYWGEPFPVIHGEDGGIYALAEEELPLELPEMTDFRPTPLPEDSTADPEPPLGRAREWVHVAFIVDDAGRARVMDGAAQAAAAKSSAASGAVAGGARVMRGRRETNTMPNWAGSCWYYLRFCDPKNASAPCGVDAERYWMVSHRKNGEPHIGGIDLYLGGTEHAVLHLLYARFWHKVLFDLGHVSTPEPFGKLYNQGLIRAFCYRDSQGTPHPYDAIDFRDDGVALLKSTGEKLNATIEKMSKSLKNVINPDDVVRDWGADSLRLYELFMGPLDQGKPWNPRDVPGVHRFLQRAWRTVVDAETGGLSRKLAWRAASADSTQPADDVERALQRTIKKVTEDLDRMAYNTAISAMMEFVNAATSAERLYADQAERFVKLLSPFAPHIAEEMWQRLRTNAPAATTAPTSAGMPQHATASRQWTGSMACEPWPTFDESLIVEAQVEMPVQINGKVRAKLLLARDADTRTIEAAALAHPDITAHLAGKAVKKVVVVPGRMVSVVV